MSSVSSKKKKEEQKAKIIVTVLVCVLFIATLGLAIFLNGFDWHGENIFGGFAPVGPSASISGAIPESNDKEEWDYFDDTVFVGDSISFGIASYNYLSFDHVFAKIGLHQGTALSSSCVYTSKTQSYTIAEALKMAKPGKVIITLGINAIYNYKQDSFYSQYEELINKIKTATPDSKIIVQSIFPVAEYWAKNMGKPDYNKFIAYANQKLYDLASKHDCYFLYTYETLTDDNGFLLTEYSGDGIHLSRDGYTAVFDYILSHPIVSSGYFTEIGAVRPPVVYNNNSSTVSMPELSSTSSALTSGLASSDTDSETESGLSTSEEASSDTESTLASTETSSDGSSSKASSNESEVEADTSTSSKTEESSEETEESSSEKNETSSKPNKPNNGKHNNSKI
ncbi:MAG: hypothetical protein IJ370_00185 [Oscillospiraceae bacterium]|nr:hypothetical protein [Oscillospiraceae bacterium]